MGVAVDAIRRGLASNAAEQCIPLRLTWPLTVGGGGVANRLGIEGGRTSTPTANQSPLLAPRRVVVEGRIAVDAIRPGLASNATERRIQLCATRPLTAGGGTSVALGFKVGAHRTQPRSKVPRLFHGGWQ